MWPTDSATGTTASLGTCSYCGLIITGTSISVSGNWPEPNKIYHPGCLNIAFPNQYQDNVLKFTSPPNDLLKTAVADDSKAYLDKLVNLVSLTSESAAATERERIALFLERKAKSFRSAIAEDPKRLDADSLKWLAREHDANASMVRQGRGSLPRCSSCKLLTGNGYAPKETCSCPREAK